MTRRAGCIIFYGSEFLMVHQPSSNFWGFPKGKLKIGELPEDGAIREVCEETGISLDPSQLGRVHRCKDSKYFEVRLDIEPVVNVDNMEIDAYMWIYLEGAKKLPTSIVTKQLLGKIKGV